MTTRVLFVENDPLFASTLEDALKQKGYRLVKAASVQEAHSKIQKQRGIKAAIADVRMEDEKNPEDRSGLILAREIAEANIPVIILSAYDKQEDIRRAFDVAPGVEPPYAFVSKNSPDWAKELNTALKEVLERQGRKVLFVENDPKFAATLEDALKQRGYIPVKAASVQEARSKIQHQRGVQAAIIDVRLKDEKTPEDWSGLVLARGIARVGIPVIILSAHDNPEDIQRAFDVAPGVEPPYAFVSKNSPAWLKALDQTLQEVIEARQAQRWRPSGLWMLAAALILAVALWISPSPQGALAGILANIALIIIKRYLPKSKSP